MRRRALAAAFGAALLVLGGAARAQTVVTAAPDPAHEILSAPFQDETDLRSGARLTSGNRLELLENGVVAFPRKLALIAGATTHVMVMTMQWNHDPSGLAYADALVARARAGVEVRAVVDGALTDLRIVSRLRAGGVKVARYNPWLLGFGGRRGRMHEKILCVDLARATVGGMNVADDYALGDGILTTRYHDVDLYVEGHAAGEVARRFLELYTFLDKTDAAAAALLGHVATFTQQPAAPAPGRDGHGRVIASEPDIGRDFIADYYVRAIRAARVQVLWHVNNTVPVDPLLSELRAAAARGVRVVIVTNSKVAYQGLQGRLNGWFGWRYVTLIERPKLYRAGIQVYEMDVPVHSKTITIDGVMASVGSFNFGESSIERNTEQVLVTYDPATVRAVEEMFERDLARARRVP